MKFPVVSNFLCCQFINYVNNFDLFVTLVLPMVFAFPVFSGQHSSVMRPHTSRISGSKLLSPCYSTSH